MARILITGATGFVGSALSKVLRRGDHLLSGTTRDPDKRMGPEGIPLYVVPELGPDTDWSRAVAGADVVVHLAARVHVMQDRAADPLNEFRRVNVEGTRSLAKAAAAAGVSQFIYMSSVKAVAERSHLEIGIDETTDPHPEDAYGTSKLEAERALAEIAGETGLTFTVIRPPLVFGPGVKGNFETLLRLCHRRVPLPLPFANIQNRRSLIYVDNLADAVARCIGNPKAANQIFFVSDEPALSTTSLIQNVGDTLGRPQRLLSLPPGLLRLLGSVTGRRETINRLLDSLVVDSTKIRATLDWHPPFTLDDGLTATAAWHRTLK